MAMFRRLTFQAKLTLSFLGLSMLSIVMVSALLTTFSNKHAHDQLRSKAALYARLLQPQLAPVVAFDDRLTAREVFGSFAADAEVAGLAVYAADGSPILQLGDVPPILLPGQVPPSKANRVFAVAPIRSAEGPNGQLCVSLGTEEVEKYRTQTDATAWVFGFISLGIALLIGFRISKAVTTRLARISLEAAQVGAGKLDGPPLELGSFDEIGQVAEAVNLMKAELRTLFVEREQSASDEQARLEGLVSARTLELEESREEYRRVAETTNAIPFTYESQRFSYVGPQAEKRLGVTLERWKQTGFLETILKGEQAAEVKGFLDGAQVGHEFEFECAARGHQGLPIQLRWVVSCGETDGKRWVRGLILDITDRKRLETELAQAQKLESVGRLAAGVAHEINTPVQFVSDSVHFLQEATGDLLKVIEKLNVVRQSVVDGKPSVEAAAEAGEMEDIADLPYLIEKVPLAFERAIDGVGRVATIVRSMKEFAHPDASEMTTIDLNRAIQSTLVIARNEYKYVAELATEYAELPPVTCHAGDVNQAVLNIVVNAAHAIGDRVKGTTTRGKITVATRRVGENGDDVEIAITDTGGGIPEAIRERIFDPFFTTKEVGKGTGQGLAISRSVVVDKHGGELTFQTELGVGTTFVIRLPIAGHGKKPSMGVAA